MKQLVIRSLWERRELPNSAQKCSLLHKFYWKLKSNFDHYSPSHFVLSLRLPYFLIFIQKSGKEKKSRVWMGQVTSYPEIIRCSANYLHYLPLSSAPLDVSISPKMMLQIDEKGHDIEKALILIDSDVFRRPSLCIPSLRQLKLLELKTTILGFVCCFNWEVVAITSSLSSV